MTTIEIDAFTTLGIEAKIHVTEEEDWELVERLVEKAQYREDLIQQLDSSQKDRDSEDVRSWSEVKDEIFPDNIDTSGEE